MKPNSNTVNYKNFDVIWSIIISQNIYSTSQFDHQLQRNRIISLKLPDLHAPDHKRVPNFATNCTPITHTYLYFELYKFQFSIFALQIRQTNHCLLFGAQLQRERVSQ